MVSDERTLEITDWLDRLRAGDDSAREALLISASERLTRLAHKMLREYPGVRRWEQTGDVLQNALIRLDRALRTVSPPTALDFFRLASAQIRRELIDLARHYFGPAGLGANYKSRCGADEENEPGQAWESTCDPVRLAAWSEFHARIGELPEADRELF